MFNLRHVFGENRYDCVEENDSYLGYFDGGRRMLSARTSSKDFFRINSTCFVKKTLHSKEFDQKWFSKFDRLFCLLLYYIIIVYYIAACLLGIAFKSH